MPNFSNAKIYSIICHSTGQQYIGSTTKENLRVRLQEHESAYRGSGGYCSSFEILKSGNYSIQLLEACPCESSEAMHRRERFHIENSIDCVNSYLPTRTIKEYYQVHKNKYIEYYQKIKDNDRFKKRYTCECGGVYTVNNCQHHYNTLRHDIWREKNIISSYIINTDDSSPPPLQVTSS